MSKKSASTLLVLLILFTAAYSVPSNISQKQARKAIARLAGFNLEEQAIDIDVANATDAHSANVSADVDVVFRAARKKDGEWVVQEFRTGPGNWEDVSTVARALKVVTPSSTCSRLLSAKLTGPGARCLVGTLLGEPPPFAAVRIKELSPLDLPIVSQDSALIVTQLRMTFILSKVSGEWIVSELRCGSGPQVSLAGLHDSIDSLKREKAKSDLMALSQALKSFQKARGIFVISDKEAVLIDHLSPRYLRAVIRLDPWHNPYQYHGDGNSYSISSTGPDGKANTADDVVVTN